MIDKTSRTIHDVSIIIMAFLIGLRCKLQCGIDKRCVTMRLLAVCVPVALTLFVMVMAVTVMGDVIGEMIYSVRQKSQRLLADCCDIQNCKRATELKE